MQFLDLQIARYLITGSCTTLINWLSYCCLVILWFNPKENAELQIINIISWILAVLFVYIANRIYVFKSQNKNILLEIGKFYFARTISLLVDMSIMFVGAIILGWNDKLIKIVSNLIVIVVNYVVSKLFIFKKRHCK